ncbi:MAG: FumA C-terminus/TtdB family hydratase beta subunit [Coriobacteriia bacterium]|nr:FumA C-terminus/TtdB family hydratase beta subunit [Coriobacteriia bacterium]
MSDPICVTLPDDAASLRLLEVGTEVLLSGRVFTARDATHLRLVAELAETGVLPYDLARETLFYAGPTPPAAGRPVGAIGPTTARRMDAWTPQLLAAGIVATIGKGARDDSVRRACVAHGAVYLAAVGGAAALLGTHVVAAETVAYPELGTEALVRLELDRLPVWVAIDVRGHELYALARRSSAGEARP